MSTIINSQSEIPLTPFYVTATDNFMSGWGPSKGKNNRIIVPCESYEEAEYVERYAKSRSDMKRVLVCAKKPKLNTKINLYSLFDREDSTAWYPTK